MCIRDSTGMNLRVNGQGEEGAGGPGNLYVSITVQEHPVFERDGNDVHVRVRLALSEALFGSSVVIPTLSGKVSLKVPPGTQTGDRRVMEGRGITAVNSGRHGAGHQYVHFEVVIPRNLSERQRALIEEFREDEPELTELERTRRPR